MTFCYPKYVLFMTFKIAKYDVKKVKYDIGKTRKTRKTQKKSLLSIVDSSQSLLWKQEFHLSFCVRFPLFQMFHIRSVGKLPSTYIINPQIYLSVCLSHPVSPEPLDLWSGNFYLSYERWGRFIQCHIRFISAVFGRKQQMEVELD